MGAGKKILFCISGGIAAYKMADVVHDFVKRGHHVRVFLTKSAEKFISPFLLATLTQEKVFREEDFFSDEWGWTIPHISLGEWADLTVVAPCTANALKTIAWGDSQTFLGALFLASPRKGLLFPSMNNRMWEHEKTQESVVMCRNLGHHVIEPDEGLLACGTVGKGKMLPIADVIEEITKAMTPCESYKGECVVVTAGPTWEHLDPVRFLSNPSSGKMGYALAREAWYRGAEVTFLTGPVYDGNLYGLKHIEVTSAKEMGQQLQLLRSKYRVLVMAAAVGDYHFPEQFSQKIKRREKRGLTFNMVPNPDLLAEEGNSKKPHQILVGFALESDHLLENAEKKMRQKKVDFIVANSLDGENNPFGSDRNNVTVLHEKGGQYSLSGTKADVAKGILDLVTPLLGH